MEPELGGRNLVWRKSPEQNMLPRAHQLFPWQILGSSQSLWNHNTNTELNRLAGAVTGGWGATSYVPSCHTFSPVWVWHLVWRMAGYFPSCTDNFFRFLQSVVSFSSICSKPQYGCRASTIDNLHIKMGHFFSWKPEQGCGGGVSQSQLLVPLWVQCRRNGSTDHPTQGCWDLLALPRPPCHSGNRKGSHFS